MANLILFIHANDLIHLRVVRTFHLQIYCVNQRTSIAERIHGFTSVLILMFRSGNIVDVQATFVEETLNLKGILLVNNQLTVFLPSYAWRWPRRYTKCYPTSAR